jgi:hydrogenase maturation protease
VGLLVGERIACQLPPTYGVAIRQFTGSPLALLQEAGSCMRLILIDAVSTGSSPVGSVRLFTEGELSRAKGDLFIHGMNLPAVLALGRRVGIALPRWIRLVGIEVGSIQEFGETPEPELAAKIDSIAQETLRIVRELVHDTERLFSEHAAQLLHHIRIGLMRLSG